MYQQHYILRPIHPHKDGWKNTMFQRGQTMTTALVGNYQWHLHAALHCFSLGMRLKLLVSAFDLHFIALQDCWWPVLHILYPFILLWSTHITKNQLSYLVVDATVLVLKLGFPVPSAVRDRAQLSSGVLLLCLINNFLLQTDSQTNSYKLDSNRAQH